jgi:hypothetical protein
MLATNTRYEIRKTGRSLAVNNLNGKSKKENAEIFKSGSIQYRKNGVADLRYKSSFVEFLKPRLRLTLGYVQNWHS